MIIRILKDSHVVVLPHASYDPAWHSDMSAQSDKDKINDSE